MPFTGNEPYLDPDFRHASLPPNGCFYIRGLECPECGDLIPWELGSSRTFVQLPSNVPIPVTCECNGYSNSVGYVMIDRGPFGTCHVGWWDGEVSATTTKAVQAFLDVLYEKEASKPWVKEMVSMVPEIGYGVDGDDLYW